MRSASVKKMATQHGMQVCENAQYTAHHIRGPSSINTSQDIWINVELDNYTAMLKTNKFFTNYAIIIL